jgi:hypothetical protein
MPADPRPDLASAMYPSLSREAKAKEAQQSREEVRRAQSKQTLMRLLRETREGLRADRERSR